MDLENTKPELTQAAAALEETQRSYAHHKDLYEKLRGDVAVKMQFLDENRVSNATPQASAAAVVAALHYWDSCHNFQIKVMHKQLILLHNAIAAYFSGNAMALESTLKQFNIKVSAQQWRQPRRSPLKALIACSLSHRTTLVALGWSSRSWALSQQQHFTP